MPGWTVSSAGEAREPRVVGLVAEEGLAEPAVRFGGQQGKDEFEVGVVLRAVVFGFVEELDLGGEEWEAVGGVVDQIGNGEGDGAVAAECPEVADGVIEEEVEAEGFGIGGELERGEVDGVVGRPVGPAAVYAFAELKICVRGLQQGLVGAPEADLDVVVLAGDAAGEEVDGPAAGEPPLAGEMAHRCGDVADGVESSHGTAPLYRDFC